MEPPTAEDQYLFDWLTGPRIGPPPALMADLRRALSIEDAGEQAEEVRDILNQVVESFLRVQGTEG
jgi:hypothetical protein